MKRYEVAIVGGGPAGAICAYELGRAGIKVALFDGSHPREKPCGGALSSRVLEEFVIPPSLLERRVDYLLLESPAGEDIEISTPQDAALIMRKEFDSYLLEQAKQEASFFPERVSAIDRGRAYWTIITPQRAIESDLIIGADGARSMVRKVVSAPPFPKATKVICTGYHIPADPDDIKSSFKNSMEIYFSISGGYLGYIWIFPKSKVISVGIGSKVGIPHLLRILDEFLDRHPAARRLPSDFIRKPYGALLPAADVPAFFDIPIAGDNWALIGDAAAHVNAVTGEGIYFAMKGGRCAAQAIIAGDILSYEERWRAEYGDDLYLSARFQKLFYRHRVLNWAIHLAQRRKDIGDILADAILGRRPYKEVFRGRNLLKRLIFS